MDHPVRTLLYKLFLEPFRRLLQRPFGPNVNASATKNVVSKAA
jgi:hypothetical protein